MSDDRGSQAAAGGETADSREHDDSARDSTAGGDPRSAVDLEREFAEEWGRRV